MIELGIEPEKIARKFKEVLIPIDIPDDVATYDDLGGPVFVCILFAFSFLLRGRVEFGSIYGFGITASTWIYFLVNLMSQRGRYVELYTCLSVLGYGFAPLLFLSYTAIFMDLNNALGYSLCAVISFWSTISASKLFEKSMS